MAIPVPGAGHDAGAAAIRHPGLLLDRWVDYASDGSLDTLRQKQHLIQVKQRSDAHPGGHVGDAWDALCREAPGATSWVQSTVWRLALHLSRAVAVENASLCLHPVRGFPYLPGSGLKGLARTQGCIERSVQTDQPLDCVDEKDPEILRVFGSTEKPAPHGSAGGVIFLEAWPTGQPHIDIDIVNSHHQKYYSSEGGEPPGDWESPNPVYFLAVAPDTAFRFAVAPRNPNDPTHVADAAKAKTWLQIGLIELGAGAKTAAGYGYFGPPHEHSPADPPPAVLASLLSDADR